VEEEKKNGASSERAILRDSDSFNSNSPKIPYSSENYNSLEHLSFQGGILSDNNTPVSLKSLTDRAESEEGMGAAGGSNNDEEEVKIGDLVDEEEAKAGVVEEEEAKAEMNDEQPPPQIVGDRQEDD